MSSTIMVITCFLVDKMEIDQIYTLEPLPLNQVRNIHFSVWGLLVLGIFGIDF